jgi:hypothetical protein
MSYQISTAQAMQLAKIALRSIDQEFPYSAQHVHRSAHDRRLPRELHPAFYGCFDWHSAVHSHWMLVRLLRSMPQLALAGSIRAALATHLSGENLQVEAAYFHEPGRSNYERPYGWAWLLKLAEELYSWDDPDAQRWSQALQPLVEVIVAGYFAYLPKLSYPVRSGMHSSTAFGLIFALDYAQATGHSDLHKLITQRSLDYFADDYNYPAAWEPSGSDFLSPALITADLMRRVLPPDRFTAWFSAYLPDLTQSAGARLLTPASVSDRSDGQIVHLDGLNLSRAWCLWGIAAALPPGDSRRATLLQSAETHASAGLAGIASGDYMGEHWLGSFALYMLGHVPVSY